MAKEIQAWGVRKEMLDMDKLALAYYLLARAIIEKQKETDVESSSIKRSDEETAAERREAA